VRIFSAFARGITFAVALAIAVSLGAQSKKHEPICSALMGISSGRTHVVDMTYALN